MRRIIWTATLLLGTGVTGLAGQVTPPRTTLRAGQRVRVMPRVPWCPFGECTLMETHRPVVGTLSSLDADSITVATDHRTARLPLAVVAHVDTFAGRHPPLVRGVVLGFAIGAAIGAPIGAALGNWCLFGACDTHPVREAAALGLRAGAIGAVLGFLIASGSGERWRAVLQHDPGDGLVPVSRASGPSARFTVGPAWDATGPGLRARLTF